jgi:hypothetical protein
MKELERENRHDQGVSRSLRDLLDLTVTDAGRANTHAAAGSIDEGANTLKIQVPTTFGDIVRVADPATELGTAPANFANLCHRQSSPVLLQTFSIANEWESGNRSNAQGGGVYS